MKNINNVKTSKGFTLIEILIIAVAIISILTAIALNQYQTYTNEAKKSKYADVLQGVGMVRAGMAVCLSLNNNVISECDTADKLGFTLPAATDNRQVITLTKITGIITGTGTTTSGGYTLIYTPDANGKFTKSGTCDAANFC